MGNSTSNANAPRPPPNIQRSAEQTSSPPPDNRDPSLRAKKKSLELPDLASLSLSPAGRPKQGTASKPAPIPIPVSPINNTAVPGEAGRIRAAITLPSTADVLSAVDEPSTHRPFPPQAQRANQTQRHPEARQAADQRRIQELYDQYQSPSPPPQASSVFIPEAVHSSIPIGLNKLDESQVSNQIETAPDLVNVTITWRGGGNVVQLARAGDDDWKGRVLMERESPDSSVHNATIALPPGTHHIRFLTDHQWQVADDYPTAVDDQGSLANYVSVPISYSPPAATNIPPSVSQKLTLGQSFWSAASSADDDGSQDTPPGSVPLQTHVPHHHHHHHQSQLQWTSEIPPELEAAAREEEAYVAASTGQVGASHTIVNGFIPAPNIPPAPSLPRHLDKLILNSRVVIGGAAPASSTSTLVGTGSRSSRSNGGREGRHASNNTGTGRTKAGREQQRDRRGGERDRDAGRGRERRSGSGSSTQPPPPPPPTEVDVEVGPGAGASLLTTPVVLSHEPSSTPTPASYMASTPTPGSHMPAPPSPLLGSPAASTPPTPTIPASTSRPLALGLVSPSEQQTLTDDGSVLPVPSHVVLHHLSTSAIRNGVLAVADSTRYRKKYLTTIYYKPTSL